MSNNGGRFADRRASTRRRAKMPIDINFSNGPSLVSGTVQDISNGGIKVKIEITPSPFRERDEVRFFTNRGYFKLRGEGVILWTSELENSAGTRFTHLDKKSKHSLEEFLGLFIDVPSNDN